MNSAPINTREVYTDLNLDQKLNQARSTLTAYKARISTIQQSQLQRIHDDINEILLTLPYALSVTKTLNIEPYLVYDDVDEIYPDKSIAFKETIHDLNSRIPKRLEAKLIKITYLSDNVEDYILVKNILTPENTLKDVSIIEVIPKSLATPETLEFFNLQPQIKTSGNYLEAKISFDSLESSIPAVILYKLHSPNIDLVKNIKTIILPNELKEKDIPFECGNSICNPGEDYLSCPEDCHCGNKICESGEDETNCPQDCKSSTALIIFIILFVTALAGFGYYLYKNPSLAKKLKIELFKIFKKQSPFSSQEELKKIVNFIQNSKAKGYKTEKIRKALTDKGWSKEKINYAIKKAKQKYLNT